MNQKIKKAYNTVEKFYSKRPILFWLITLLISSVPFLATWKHIKAFLNKEYVFKGYEFLILILIPFAIIGMIKILTPDKFIQDIVKELNSMKNVLDMPFEITRPGFMNSPSYIEKYYHSEIIEFFNKYNDIVLKLRKKNSKKFGNIKTRDDIPHVGTDYVRVNQMQVIKSDIEFLLGKLN